MISLNAYFLQSSALKNITTLFGVASRDPQTVTAPKDIVAAASSATGGRNAVSAQVGDAVLGLTQIAEPSEDKSLPPGWSKYGSPGVRGYESLDEIEDPELRTMFERSEELSRRDEEVRLTYGIDSVEWLTRSWSDADREAAFNEVKPVRDRYGVDSVEYHNAVKEATKLWGMGDLLAAQTEYDISKRIVETGTYGTRVYVRNEQTGLDVPARDEKGGYIYEYKPYSEETIEFAKKTVAEYAEKVAKMLPKAEIGIRQYYGLTGQLMVQDENGEYQWGAFRAYNTATGGTAYALSANGIMTSYGNSGEVLASSAWS